MGISSIAEAEDGCKIAERFAESFMKARQQGVKMSSLMKICEDPQHPEVLRTISKEILIEAYETPRFSTPGIIEKTIRDFQNKWYLKCIKAQR